MDAERRLSGSSRAKQQALILLAGVEFLVVLDASVMNVILLLVGELVAEEQPPPKTRT